MKKFKVTVPCDYFNGYLRHGHGEAIIEAKTLKEAKEKAKTWDDYEPILDDYELNDHDAWNFENMTIEEIVEEKKTKENSNVKELNLLEKLSSISNELGVLSKELNVQINKSSSYKAVSERTILDAIKPLENKYRVFSYPIKREIIETDVLTKETEYNAKTTTTNTLFMRLEITYRFINIDNMEEFIDITSYGDGMDTGDKAPGKAMTYADKYALMKAYKISTGDDPDKDASPEEGYKSTKKTTKKSKEEKKETDFRNLLLDELKKREIDVNQYAKEHKLNANTTQQEAKEFLEQLIYQDDSIINATIGERLGQE